jgi:hypothetical protein
MSSFVLRGRIACEALRIHEVARSASIVFDAIERDSAVAVVLVSRHLASSSNLTPAIEKLWRVKRFGRE